MSDNGKGSEPRPYDANEYARNHQEIKWKSIIKAKPVRKGELREKKSRE